MKKFLCILLFAVYAFGFEWSVAKSSLSHYNSVFVNNDNVYGLITTGFLIKSNDNGKTWLPSITIDNSSEQVYLTDIWMYKDSIGVICGNSDGAMVIYRTKTKGNIWQEVYYINATSYDEFNKIKFKDNILWIVGDKGTCVKSSDFGVTWIKKITNITDDILSIDFYNAKYGFIATNNGKILKTTNGGETWEIKFLPLGVKQVYDIYIVDTLNILAVGSFGQFIYSTDAGNSWDNRQIVLGVNFSGINKFGNEYIIIGNNGNLFTSKDLNTWKKEKLPLGFTSANFTRINYNKNYVFVSASGGIIKGIPEIIDTVDIKENGYVFVKDNKLHYYDYKAKKTYNNIIDVGPIPNDIYADTNWIIITNSGQYGNQSSIQIFKPNDLYQYLNDNYLPSFQQKIKKIELSDAANAYETIAINDTLLASTLAQINKVILLNPVTNKIIQEISTPAGNPQGIIRETDSTFIVTIADWGDGTGKEIFKFNVKKMQKSKSVVTHLNPVDIIKTKKYYVAWTWGSWMGQDNYGTLIVLDTNLNKITETRVPKNGKISQVIEISDTTLLTEYFDENYDFHKYIYNIKSGQIDTLLNDFYLNNTFVKKFNDYFLIKESSNAIRIYSQKNNKTEVVLPFYSKLISQYFYPKILTNTKQEEDKNIKYQLFLENYPNPFNPITNIRFSIPFSGKVNLTIFNLLGEKIETLFDGELNKGVYNFAFNAQNLASGIYLARLSHNNNIKTLKLLLLK